MKNFFKGLLVLIGILLCFIPLFVSAFITIAGSVIKELWYIVAGGAMLVAHFTGQSILASIGIGALAGVASIPLGFVAAFLGLGGIFGSLVAMVRCVPKKDRAGMLSEILKDTCKELNQIEQKHTLKGNLKKAKKVGKYRDLLSKVLK